MIEGEGNPSRQPEPLPRPETPEQRRAQGFWNRVIESVPIVAAGVGRGRSPELQPVATADRHPAAAEAAARQGGQLVPGARDAFATSETPDRAIDGKVWQALIESQPAQPASASSLTRAQDRTPGS